MPLQRKSMAARAELAPRAKSEPRQRDPERTRASILDAATQEFSLRGLEGARVDAIAERAGVNKRMLYHYFGDKDALFLAVMEAAYEDIRRREAELDLTGRSPEDAIAAIVRFTFRYYLENQHFIALLGSENLSKARHIRRSRRVKQINQPIIDALRRVLDEGARAGVFRKGVDALQLYMSLAGLSYFYFCNMHTLSVVFDRDLASAPALAERERHAVEVILGYLRQTASEGALRRK